MSIAKVPILQLPSSKLSIPNQRIPYHMRIVLSIDQIKGQSHETIVESFEESIISSEFFDPAIVGSEIVDKKGRQMYGIVVDGGDQLGRLFKLL